MKEKITKGYENISVEVLDYTKDIAEHAWNMYRMTWVDLQNVPYDPTNPKVVEAIRNIVLFRALPVPREQAILTFRVNNISRVCMSQITRQRKAAFNVESQMPRPINHNMMIPLSFYGTKYEDRIKELAALSHDLYDEMHADGFPPQDIRYLTLQGQTLSLSYAVDVNTFTSAFGFRTENNLSDEINLVYRLAKQAILNQVNEDFENGTIDVLTHYFYTTIINKADAWGAAQKVGQNYDMVFGNQFERYPAKDKEVEEITANADYDFNNSAWKQELIKLYNERPELLVHGEIEMIEKWLKKED